MATNKKLYIDKLPQFDLPVDFIVYGNITTDLLNFYASYPCKIQACIFAFVSSGSIKTRINLWDYTIRENDFVAIFPGSFIQIEETSSDTKISFAGFSSSFLKTVNFYKYITSLMFPIFKNPVFSLKPELASIFGDMMALLTKAGNITDPLLSPGLTQSIFKLYIEMLLQIIKNTQHDNKTLPTSRERTILSEFLQLAFDNYRDEHKISFYASEANLSLSHFCNVISRTAGMTPQEIIMSLIIMDAKTQLKGTSNSVSSIATSLGFPTPTTFTRYFKTYTGMTPQEYRNK